MTERGQGRRKKTGVQTPLSPPLAHPNVTFQALCLPEATPEYRFHPERRWRLDWAWVPNKIALEVDGGIKIDNIAAIAKSGADTFVAGSAIFHSQNYADTIEKLREKVTVIK